MTELTEPKPAEQPMLGWLPVVMEGRIWAWAWRDNYELAIYLLQKPAVGRPN